ncbi:MAG: ABC transporter ATP-binding protein [Beijerinckiaceae bacterium]
MSLLEAESISKCFGRFVAVRDVTLRFEPGEIHAVIGPNGAGKTTFLNLLSGELSASSGSLRFGGQDVTHWAPERRANAGMGRSFQHSSVFENLSVRENLRLAAQTRFPKAFGLWRTADSYGEVAERVVTVCSELSLSAPEERLAGELSHGEQRQLEIGMLIATSPKLMLLDEPTSGMSRNETLDLIKILRRLSESHTLVLVEHDMDVVFQLADRITVLVNGTVIASGKPEEVRADAGVRSAYLGVDG